MSDQPDDVRGARLRPPRAIPGWLAAAIVVLIVIVIIGGYLWANGSDRAGRVAGVEDLTPDDATTGVLWEGEGSALTMGSNGWFFVNAADTDGPAVINARTGERWTPERLGLIPTAVLADGRVVVAMGSDVDVHDSSGAVQTTRAVDILRAFGDRSLKAGQDAFLVGISESTLAVLTCLAPETTNLEREAPGSRQVLAGITIDRGDVGWTRDLGVPCGSPAMAGVYHPMPPMPYLPVAVGDRTDVIDLSTGKAALSLDDAPLGRVIVGADRVIHRVGDTVTARSLPSREVTATTGCPGARLSYTGSSAGLLAPQGVAEVRCKESVRLLGDDGFVAVDVPPVGEDQRVPDGQSRVFGRLVMRRDGGTLHLRDALTDTDLGNVDVPEDFRVGTSQLRGHAVIFFASLEEDDSPFDQQDRTLDTEVRIVDVRTGHLAIRSRQRLAPGSEATPEGYVGLQARLEEEQGRPGPFRELPKPESQYAWVVATGP